MSRSRLSRFVVSALAIALLSALELTLQLNIDAQQPCPNIPRNSFPKWRPGARVTVIFDENYGWTDNIKTAIKRAFDFWSAARTSNGSGVEFVGFQSGPYPDVNTAIDVFIVSKDAAAQNPGAATIQNDFSGGYAAVGVMKFPESVEIEPPSWDPGGWGAYWHLVA
jgi:hypothetical protein